MGCVIIIWIISKTSDTLAEAAKQEILEALNFAE